jgi:protein NrfC
VNKLLAVKDSVRIKPHLGTDPSVRYIPVVSRGV